MYTCQTKPPSGSTFSSRSARLYKIPNYIWGVGAKDTLLHVAVSGSVRESGRRGRVNVRRLRFDVEDVGELKRLEIRQGRPGKVASLRMSRMESVESS